MTYVIKMAEQINAISSIKLGGFQSQLEASCMSNQTEELWYNETVCLWMTIYVCVCVCVQYILTYADSTEFSDEESSLKSFSRGYAWGMVNNSWKVNN